MTWALVTGLLDRIPSWLYALVIAGLLLVAGGLKQELGSARVALADEKVKLATAKAEFADERTKATLVAVAQAEVNAKESLRRMERAAQREGERDAKFQSIQRQLGDALERLRNRPDRPAAAPGGAVSGNPAPAAACTGAELYRPDAEFLVREAARAQRLIVERDYCHDRYDSLTK